jgi:Trk K+ transport system NAD-binding subunit
METHDPDGPDRDDGSGIHPEPDAGVVVVGGAQVGRRIAKRLALDHPVHHVDASEAAVADPAGYETTHASNLASAAALAEADVSEGDLAIVLMRRDSQTLLVTQLLRTTFGLERVYAVLTDPRNRDAFDITGVEVICGADAIAEATLSSAGTATTADLPVESMVEEDSASDVPNTVRTS